MPLDPSSQAERLLRRMRNRANSLVSAIVLETDSELKRQSPVDEGTFRASWRISEGESDSSVSSTGDAITSPYSREIRFGKNYYLTNSLPYAQKLADGHSIQASPGWIALIAANTKNRANELIRAIRNG
jgi:hypothetical protein